MSTPFEGRSLPGAVRGFTDHLNGLLARTVTQTRIVAVVARSDESRRPSGMQLAFRQGGRPIAARLRTRFGPMRLFLGWECDSVVAADGIHRIQVDSYVYRLTPEGTDEALLRWEYVRHPADPDARWCRHHLQGPVPLLFAGGHEMLLDELHLPTGWVPIEDVLRFCIVDMGVRPLSPGWHEALTESRELTSVGER